MALQPNLEATRLAQGMYRMYVLTDLAGAKQSFAAAHALKPQDAWPLLNSGLVSEDRGDYAEAIQTFRQASVLDPRELSPLLEMAGVQITLRRYAAATRTLKRASAVAPDSAGPPVIAARAYSLMGDLDGMHAVLAAAPAHARADYSFQLERGRYFVFRRDFAAASRIYQAMASKAATQGWQVACALGDVAWDTGQRTAARPHYRRCAA